MDDCNIEEVLKFLKDFSWVYNFQITRFFVEEVWKSFPSEWEEPLFGLSVAELNNLPFGHLEDDWPDSLKIFVRYCLTYTLPRQAAQIMKTVDIDQDMRRGMSPKKEHEVKRMASVVHRIAEKAGSRVILDIGSGLGYLGQVLHREFGYDVVGFESQQSHTSGAEKRASNVKKDGIHNVTFQLENCEESVKEFENLIQRYLSDQITCKNKQLPVRKKSKHLCDVSTNSSDNICDTVCQQTNESCGNSNNQITNNQRNDAVECGKSNFELSQKLDETCSSTTNLYLGVSCKSTEERHFKGTDDFSCNNCVSCEIDNGCEKCRSTNSCHGDSETYMKCTLTDSLPDGCQQNTPEINKTMERPGMIPNQDLYTTDPICTTSSYTGGAVMVGLHCCGDLTPTMLSFYSKIDSIRALCCVSCCYHRMKFNNTEESFDNFPLSDKIKTIYKKITTSDNVAIDTKHENHSLENPKRTLASGDADVNSDDCGSAKSTDIHDQAVVDRCCTDSLKETSVSTGYQWRFNVYSMRLAAQETRGRWKNQMEEDHKFHIKNVGYRGILELYVNKWEVTFGKLFRKLVRKADFSSFSCYLDAACRRSDHDPQTDQCLNKSELHNLYDNYKDKFKYIEPFTVLQVMLQPLLESLIYKDRQLWLEEHEIKCEILPLFDETISPRNLALVSIKDLS